jgi:sulfite exporter TauE/SafE
MRGAWVMVAGVGFWMAGVLIDAAFVDVMLIILGALMIVAGLRMLPATIEQEED